jgi:lysine 2,3-aminomutase
MRLEDKIKPAPRRAVWASVPEEKWTDWKWQLTHRLNSVEELSQVIRLTEAEKRALSASHLFRVDITPYFASLIDPDDPYDPIRRQVIPTIGEKDTFMSMMDDSLAEDRHSPVPGLVHRYPDRVLMLATTQCASYCRYCTRSRIVGDGSATFSRAERDAQIDYIARTPQIRDVLISGGDPLVLPPSVLEDLLARLRDIPHVEIVRIGSRVPSFMPQRITQELCDMLARYHPLWINIHVNHPNEVTAEMAQATDRLTRAGIPLGSQTVLLAGVNDSVHIMRDLFHRLVMVRVRPYYLYQCDLVKGAGHFRTSVAKGLEIMEGLRGHTSGFAVPTYVIDAPGGGGKIPVMPNYVLSMAPGRTVVRNYEGYITTYTEPTDYDPEAVKPLEERVARRPEPGQEGVLGLLEGQRLAVEPAGFAEAHERGTQEIHRLKADAHKWQPLGVGEEVTADKR